MKLNPRNILLVAAATLLALVPTAGAVSDFSETPVNAQMGTLCPVVGVGACAFLCNAGDFISTHISWTGQVTASCGGAGDSCVWGIDHLLPMEPCNHTGGQASSTGAGTCVAIVVVLAICSAG